MNSKSEFNRFIIPRISIDSDSEALKRLREEEEAERERKKKVSNLKKRKADTKDEDLKEICMRMLNENNERWKKREREEVDREEESK